MFRPFLATLLMTLLAIAGAADGGLAVGRAGQSVTLTVTFSFQQQLLNREAPNTLEFVTPWGKTRGTPSGTPLNKAEFQGYFAQVKALPLRVKVPASVKSGKYTAHLTGKLYLCDKKEKVCTQRSVNLPVTVQVLASGHLRAAAPLRLTDALLAPQGRRNWLR